MLHHSFIRPYHFVLCRWITLPVIYLCQSLVTETDWLIFLFKWKLYYRMNWLYWLYLLLVIILCKSISSYKLSMDHVPLPMLCIICLHFDAISVSHLHFPETVSCVSHLRSHFCRVNLTVLSTYILDTSIRLDTNMRQFSGFSINNRWLV